MSHKAHLLSCALNYSYKLQEIQSLEILFQWPSKVHRYQHTQTHTVFVLFYYYYFIEKKKKLNNQTKTDKQHESMKIDVDA